MPSVSSMMANCCVVGCRFGKGKVAGRRLFLVPVQPSRRKAWLIAVGRNRATQTRTKKKANHLYVCSEHFISKAKSNIPGNPDYVPSVNLRRHLSALIKKNGKRASPIAEHNPHIVKTTDDSDYPYELYSSQCASSRLDANSLVRLRQNRGLLLLEERVDLHFGVLDQLLASEVLNEVEYSDLKAIQSTIVCWTKLHEYISSERDRSTNANNNATLTTALQSTKQQHLLNYAWNSGVYNAKFGGDWPLTERQMTTLNVNQEVLLELMEMSSQLIEQMSSRNVLSRRHKDFIGGPLSQFKRNETFLDILRRRSFRDYKETIGCLRRSKQKHIAEILEGGIVIRILCTLKRSEGCTINRSTTETALKRLSEKLNMQSSDDEHEHWQLTKIGLIGVRFDDAIVFYFKCSTINDLNTMKNMFQNGEIQTMAESDFRNLLSRGDRPVNAMLEWNYVDLKRCTAYLIRRPFSDACMHELPMEVLEIILTKAYALYFYRVEPRPCDKELFAMLLSVSRNWLETIARRRFKVALNRRLSPYFLSLRKRQTIIRSNRQYLVEYMKPSTVLIRRLVDVGCLTRKEANYVEGLRYNTRKNCELLNVARRLNFKKHFDLVESLHLCDQPKVADVLEKGGVVFKAMATCAGVLANSDFIKQLNETISENNKIYRELVQFINRFDDEIPKDLEILEVQRFGTRQRKHHIVIWLWCKSQKSCRQLCKLVQSEQLLEKLNTIMTYVLEQSTQGAIPTRTIYNTKFPKILEALSLETKEFQKAVAVRQLSVKLSGEFSLPQNSRAVTSLHDKIYILTDHLISVYQDSASFTCISKTLLPTLQPPSDSNDHPDNLTENRWFIEACGQTKHIYVARLQDRRIYKLTTIPEYNLEVWMRYVAAMRSLSVARNGNVLILKLERRGSLEMPNGRPTFSLEIYTKYGVQLYNIDLNLPVIEIGTEFPMLLEISPGNVVISSMRILFVKSVSFSTLSATDRCFIRCPDDRFLYDWSARGFSSIALYSASRMIAVLLDQFAILDSRLNAQIIPKLFNGYEVTLHYRQDKRQAMIWVSGGSTICIYTLTYEGEDMFPDDA